MSLSAIKIGQTTSRLSIILYDRTSKDCTHQTIWASKRTCSNEQGSTRASILLIEQLISYARMSMWYARLSDSLVRKILSFIIEIRFYIHYCPLNDKYEKTEV